MDKAKEIAELKARLAVLENEGETDCLEQTEKALGETGLQWVLLSPSHWTVDVPVECPDLNTKSVEIHVFSGKFGLVLINFYDDNSNELDEFSVYPEEIVQTIKDYELMYWVHTMVVGSILPSEPSTGDDCHYLSDKVISHTSVSRKHRLFQE